MVNKLICRVAIPTPLRRSFDYLPPADLSTQELQALQPGTRVRVKFGHQTLIGILLSMESSSDIPADKLKPVQQIIDVEPIVNSEILELCRWAANYYQHPIGETLATAIPSLLRQGESASLPTTRMWRLTTHGLGLPADGLKRSPKQSALLSMLHQTPLLSNDVLKQTDISTSTLREMEKKGLIEAVEIVPAIESNKTAANKEATLAETPLALNPEQQAALDQLRFNEFNTYLLEGTTGSGKTEVYLQAITQVLALGRKALVLVPEIGLTPQLIGRFQARFHCPIATLHSGLNHKERLNTWLETSRGQASIIIGTRSAVFTPIPDLGIIIIDEEHDLSFKQQDGLRYSARDLAVVRAQRLNIPLLLGTATPSLESLYNASQKRYQHLRLTQRAGGAVAPTIEMVDLRGQTLEEGLSQTLINYLQTELDKGNQALVFINRRGFAPTLLCRQCGWIASCNHCSARMTMHQSPPHLHCHHCNHQRPVARQCPDCLSSDLELLGQGTERSEVALQQHFPDIPIYRVDRDSTRRKNSLNKILDTVHTGEPCILVGTQMLAKGHHFPDVTLVAILDIDSGLFSADFRGPERMGQLLIQVAGRAGRADKPGTVVIQSYHCDHPSIQSLVNEGYHRYARRLLHERQLTVLPPYRYLALIRSESKRAENAIEFLKTARNIAQQKFKPSQQLSFMGPLPALLERKQDRYCFQLHISSDSRQHLHRVLQHLCQQMENHPLSRRARWSVDVDPQDMA